LFQGEGNETVHRPITSAIHPDSEHTDAQSALWMEHFPSIQPRTIHN